MPSQSRSRIWKPSRSVRTCAGWSLDRALPRSPPTPPAPAARIGRGPDEDTGLRGAGAMLPLPLSKGVGVVWREPKDDAPVFLVGEPVGVELRRGEGEAGDSGRRKGELRDDGTL